MIEKAYQKMEKEAEEMKMRRDHLAGLEGDAEMRLLRPYRRHLSGQIYRSIVRRLYRERRTETTDN